jgi:chromosome segregation ATPase
MNQIDKVEQYLKENSDYTPHYRFDDCEYSWDSVIGWLESYASQQTASLQKQVEELRIERDEYREQGAEYRDAIQQLRAELSLLQELTALREDRTLFDEALKMAKRLQDKEKELHAAHTRIEELTAKNLKLLNENNDLWDKVNNPKMKI